MKPIVVVDDDPDHIELMVLALRSGGVECPPVVTFSSSEECVTAIERGLVKPRLVLLDVNMPALDGPSAARRLRTFDAMHTVPIVMMSTSDLSFDVGRARAAGANGYVVKPQRDQTWQDMVVTLRTYWAEIDLGECA